MPSNEPSTFDVTAIYQMLRELRQETIDSRKQILIAIRDLSQRLALVQSNVIALTEEIKIFSAEATNSRLYRLQVEVEEQEQERKLLEQRIQAINDQLEEKKVLKDGIMSTTGRMKAIPPTVKKKEIPMYLIDPVLHASLVVVMTAFVNFLFGLLGLDLGGDVATGLATALVGYILSLFGYALWVRATLRSRGLTADNQPRYKPPFS